MASVGWRFTVAPKTSIRRLTLGAPPAAHPTSTWLRTDRAAKPAPGTLTFSSTTSPMLLSTPPSSAAEVVAEPRPVSTTGAPAEPVSEAVTALWRVDGTLSEWLATSKAPDPPKDASFCVPARVATTMGLSGTAGPLFA